MTARSAILNRLRSNRASTPALPLDDQVIRNRQWSPQERVTRLRESMEAVHTEIVECKPRGFGALFRQVCAQKRIQRLLVGPGTDLTRQVSGFKKRTPETVPELVPYAEPVESTKDLLFAIDASLTSVRSAIADTGSLILWPTPQEPRLMSLVPPIHLAVLKASTLHNTFLEALEAEQWADGLPTNALLISGPSKTADIEQMLVYGIHGPKELVVFILNDLDAATSP